MASPLTFDQLRRKAEGELRAAGIETPSFDIKLMLGSVAGLSSADLISEGRKPVPAIIVSKFQSMMRRRIVHEPVAYILGYQAFWSLDFQVNKDVLIPRPETEGVVGRALELLEQYEAPDILDVGTGSGAILISLLHERKDARGVAVDIAEAALDVAQGNAVRWSVSDRMQVKLSNFSKGVEGQFTLIVSNPPYVTDAAMDGLDRTVGRFEPHLALRGGADGLCAYREIIDDLQRLLKPDGVVVFEIGYDQAEDVAALLESKGFLEIGVDQDLAGHDRIVHAKNCA